MRPVLGNIGPFAAFEVEAGEVEEPEPVLDVLDILDIVPLVVEEVVAPAPPVVVVDESDFVEVEVRVPKVVVVREQDRTRSFASTNISIPIDTRR